MQPSCTACSDLAPEVSVVMQQASATTAAAARHIVKGLLSPPFLLERDSRFTFALHLIPPRDGALTAHFLFSLACLCFCYVPCALHDITQRVHLPTHSTLLLPTLPWPSASNIYTANRKYCDDNCHRQNHSSSSREQQCASTVTSFLPALPPRCRCWVEQVSLHLRPLLLRRRPPSCEPCSPSWLPGARRWACSVGARRCARRWRAGSRTHVEAGRALL